MIPTAFNLYLFLLIFAPLALGCVHQWSQSILEIVSFAALGLLMVDHLRHREPLVSVPGLLPLLLLAAWGLLQLIPLPAGLVALISPMTHAYCQETLGIVQPLAWMPLSLSSRATLTGLFRLSAYIAFYVLSVQLLADKRYLKRTVVVVVVFIALLSFIAIVGRVNSNGLVLWVYDAKTTGFYGPYINRNHMAGLLVMMLPVIAALFLLHRPPIRYQSLRESLMEFFNVPRLSIYALSGLGAGVTLIAVFLSLSRGGMISASLSIGLLYGLLYKINARRPGMMALIIGGVLVFMLVGWYGWTPIVQRFDRIVDEQGNIREQRPVIWRDSLVMAADFPVTGTGIGTFGDVFPAYQSFPGDLRDKHAHNDYIESLATGGGVSVLLMAWFVVSVTRSTHAAFRRRRESYCRFLYLGAAAGLVGIGTHSLLDFNLQIGANGLYFFFLLGLLVSAAHTRLQVLHQATTLEKVSVDDFRMFMPLCAGALVASLLYGISIGMAGWHFQSVVPFAFKESLPMERKILLEAHLKAAAAWDPFDDRYPLMLADVSGYDGDVDAAEAYYLRVLRFLPVSTHILQAYGRMLGQAGQAEKAERLLLAAIRFARQSPSGYQAYAQWLVDAGRTEEGMRQMHEAMNLAPGQADSLIDAMAAWGVSDAAMRASIPDLADPCLTFADYLQAHDNIDLSVLFFQKAVAAAAKAEPPVAGPFFHVYRFYAEQNRWFEALQVLQRGIETLPKNTKLRLALAGTYERQGITYRAAEEYRQALMLNPYDLEIKAAIDRLAGS